ncbi:hypothetical protein ASZ90_018180 [hydrocarbon metagenome]|uniref:Mobile element protein n=1 Tax=hydrocarbon metagenome TaxID=938273 RepID=A0A0W8E7J0_9ZZZZ
MVISALVQDKTITLNNEREKKVGAYSYRSVNSILEKGLDQLPFTNASPKSQPFSKHANVRGPEYYSKEGD